MIAGRHAPLDQRAAVAQAAQGQLTGALFFDAIAIGIDRIGGVDVLIVPVGGGPTIGGEPAAELVRSLAPRLVVPMHYRTPAINFLEPPDAFRNALGARVERLETSEATVEDLLGDASAPTVVLLAPPTLS